eukprot:6349179-Pyramimonas_sp.AAC.1
MSPSRGASPRKGGRYTPTFPVGPEDSEHVTNAAAGGQHRERPSLPGRGSNHASTSGAGEVLRVKFDVQEEQRALREGNRNEQTTGAFNRTKDQGGGFRGVPRVRSKSSVVRLGHSQVKSFGAWRYRYFTGNLPLSDAYNQHAYAYVLRITRQYR